MLSLDVVRARPSIDEAEAIALFLLVGRMGVNCHNCVVLQGRTMDCSLSSALIFSWQMLIAQRRTVRFELIVTNGFPAYVIALNFLSRTALESVRCFFRLSASLSIPQASRKCFWKRSRSASQVLSMLDCL